MKGVYTKTIIANLCEWLSVGSPVAYEYLVENNNQELIKTVESILMEDKGLAWLIENKFYVLSAFVKAVEGEENSIAFLFKTNPIWAATAAAINDDKQALTWLVKNGMPHYANLANLISKKLEDNKSSGFSALYRGPY